MRTLVRKIGIPLGRQFRRLIKPAGIPMGCRRFEAALALPNAGKGPWGISPCPATAFPSKAQRPHYSVLDPSLAEAVTQHTMRPWKDALLEYMQRRETKQ